MSVKLLNRLEAATGVVIEALEARRLMSITMEGSVMVIRGTEGQDSVGIVANRQSAGTDDHGVYRVVWTLQVSDSNTSRGGMLLFDHSQITGIRIELGGGNDQAGASDFYGDFDIPVTMIGGAGRDYLRGGRADDFIDGGTGADTIVGGGGNDVILDDGATIDPDLIIDRNDVVHGTARLEDGIVKVVLTGNEDNDVMVGTAFVPGNLRVTVDGLTRQFDRAAVRGIYIDAGPGNDLVYFYNGIYGLVNVPVTVVGGAGNDAIDGQGDRDSEQHTIAVRGHGPYAPVTLIGGDGDDTMYGGIGDALMDGGAGDDHFVNGWGRNTIIDEPPTPVDPVTPIDLDPVVEPAPDDGSGQDTLLIAAPAAAAASAPLGTADATSPMVNSVLESAESQDVLWLERDRDAALWA